MQGFKQSASASPGNASSSFRAAVVNALACPAFFLFRGVLRAVLRTRTGWKLALGLVKAGNEVSDEYLFRYRIPVLHSEWEAGIMLFTLAQLNGAVNAIPGDNFLAKGARGFLDSVTDLLFESMVRCSNLPADVTARDEAALEKTKSMSGGAAEKKNFEEFQHIVAENDIKVVIVNGSKYASDPVHAVKMALVAFLPVRSARQHRHGHIVPE